jgi:hypothetical protein
MTLGEYTAGSPLMHARKTSIKGKSFRLLGSCPGRALAFFAMLAACIASSLPPAARAAGPGPAQHPLYAAPAMGVNIGSLADWSRLKPFVDMMKTSRVWGLPDTPWQATPNVDHLGWPTTDAGVVVAVEKQDVGDSRDSYRFLPAGIYRLSFRGQAKVMPVASRQVSVRKYRYDAETDQSFAEVEVGTRAPQMMLSFTQTRNGVRDVRLLRPGYDGNRTFTDEFLRAIEPFSMLRFMDFLSTNVTDVRSWAERTLPQAATQTGRRGAAMEYVIQIANEAQKDIWINIPVHANDDYIRSLARLLRDTLDPHRVIYLEYSNELWNTQFMQESENRKAAIAEAGGGDTTLTRGVQCTEAQFNVEKGNPCNPYWAGYYRAGKRIVRIGHIFAGEFGAGSLNTRVRPIYATQWANPAIAEQVLKNVAMRDGPPSSLLYAIAVAPYISLPRHLIGSETLTVDQILAALSASMEDKHLPHFAAGRYVAGAFQPGVSYDGGNWTQSTHKALADYWGLRMVAYEAGVDLGQSPASGEMKFKANVDPRMGELLHRQLAAWYACGNGPLVYYSLVSHYGRHGYWGLTNDPADLDTPKFRAARAIAAGTATPGRCG